MSLVASTSIRPRSAGGEMLAGLSPLAVALIAVAILAGLDHATDPGHLAAALGDTDDATRLVEVRDFLAGAPWTSATLHQFGAAGDYVSHWSRLIDAGLAGLIRLFSLVLPMPAAETATRFLWPLLLLVALLATFAAEARRRARTADSGAATWIAVALGAAALTGTVEFTPGRIDHHNAMLVCALAGIALLARARIESDMGRWAGVVLAIGTAIGLEAIVLTAGALSIAVLAALWSGRGLVAMRDAAIAYAATLFALLLLTTAPSRLLVSHCDALSINLVLLAASGAAGLALVARHGSAWSLPVRLGCLMGAVGLGLALYGVAEPACLAGPFGQTDPAIGPIWLTHVSEVQGLRWLIATAPGLGLVAAMWMLLGLLAALHLARGEDDRADGIADVSVLALGIVLACWQIKLLPYATFLAVVPLARVIAALPGTPKLSAPVLRGFVTIVASQMGLATLIGPAAARLPVSSEAARWTGTARACIETAAVAPLAGLRPGLVLADRDLGPFIAALTPNRVVAAPYHRMDKAIIENDRLLLGSAEATKARLAELGVGYVAICPGFTRPFGRTIAPDSLLAIAAGAPAPSWLEPVALAAPSPIKVWRVQKH